MSMTLPSRYLTRCLALVVFVTMNASAGETVVSEAAAMPAATVKPGTWVVLGSSTAAGAGAPRNKGWVALVAAAFAPQGAQLVNLAKSGSVTYQGLSSNGLRVGRRPRPDPKKNIDAALGHSPVMLILSYPTNDTALRYGVDETVNNLLAIRAQALAAGAAVIVTSTQPRKLSDGALADLRAIDDRLLASIGPCFVGVRDALADADGRLAPMYDAGDGVHPGRAGHAIIARHVIELIRSSRCVRLVKS